MGSVYHKVSNFTIKSRLSLGYHSKVEVGRMDSVTAGCWFRGRCCCRCCCWLQQCCYILVVQQWTPSYWAAEWTLRGLKQRARDPIPAEFTDTNKQRATSGITGNHHSRRLFLQKSNRINFIENFVDLRNSNGKENDFLRLCRSRWKNFPQNYIELRYDC